MRFFRIKRMPYSGQQHRKQARPAAITGLSLFSCLKAMKVSAPQDLGFFSAVLLLGTLSSFVLAKSAAAQKDPEAANKEYPLPKVVWGFMMKETFREQDYAEAKAWGANVIRIPMFPARWRQHARALMLVSGSVNQHADRAFLLPNSENQNI
jgi:hypothetical protein